MPRVFGGWLALRMRAPATAVVSAFALLATAPLHASGQEAHAGAQGFVYETELVGVRNGALELYNGATVEASAAVRGAHSGTDVLLVFLRSGCRIFVAGIGLSRCTTVTEPPADAPRTIANLVFVERVLDGGVTIVLSGGSVMKVDEQAEFTNTWRPGEAILIGDVRLLHLDYGNEIVAVVRGR